MAAAVAGDLETQLASCRKQREELEALLAVSQGLDPTVEPLRPLLVRSSNDCGKGEHAQSRNI